MFNNIARLFRYKLVIPLLRSRHGPEHRARGVMIGLACSMTPLVGLQMLIVAAIWGVQRLVAPQWRFSVVIAMAWTWVSNVFTVPPLYYLFLVTGQVMLGRWGEASSFSEFSDRLEKVMSLDLGGLSTVWLVTVELFSLWGVPMFLGCIPWAIIVGWVGYRWSFRFVNRRRREKAHRMARRRAQRASNRVRFENTC